MFEIRGLTKTYHVGDVDVVALRDVSLRLPEGEFEPGDPVSKGAVVPRLVPADAPLLDPRTRAELTAAVEAARAAQLQAQAERDRAAATLSNARDLLCRREQPVEAGAVSREDLETARTGVETAESMVRAAAAAVSQAGHQGTDVVAAPVGSLFRRGIAMMKLVRSSVDCSPATPWCCTRRIR